MGINTFPSGGGGSPIKSIQRGEASSSGNITISAVNTAKTMVRSFSTGSSGTVSAPGTINAQNISGNISAGNISYGGAPYTSTLTGFEAFNSTRTVPMSSKTFSGASSTSSISGGSTNLTSAEFGIYLVNSTTITATGACRWEVIEFN